MLRRRADRGASAVEFALVMPFLLLLVFGLIQYGLYFWALQGGSDLARSAARLSAVGNTNACTALSDAVEAQAGGWADTDPEVSRSYTDSEEPNALSTEWEPGDTVQVTVRFQAIDLNFPFVPFIDDGVVSETVDARVERIDGQPEECPETP